jgi:Na+/proline symporter
VLEARRAGSQLLDGALWAASFILLVLSFVLSWGAPPDLGPSFYWSDKAWHFLGYAALSGTLLLAAVWRPGRGDGRFAGKGIGVAVVVVLVAWLTEALQAPFHRDVDLLDAATDLAGVAAGLLAWEAVRGWTLRSGPTSGSSEDRRSVRRPRTGGRRSR